jgi:hypothetical protein
MRTACSTFTVNDDKDLNKKVEDLRSALPSDAKLCLVQIKTGYCCGLEHDNDKGFLTQCTKEVNKEFGFAFCSRPHQFGFEKAHAKALVKRFYDVVAVVNLKRHDLRDRFYEDFMPIHYMAIANAVNIPLAIASPRDRSRAYAKKLASPVSLATGFLDDVKADLEKLEAELFILEATEHAKENCRHTSPEKYRGLFDSPFGIVSPDSDSDSDEDKKK